METKRRMKTLWFFFTKLDESKNLNKPDEFGCYIEAIIPLGRSVTQAIQKEFKHKAGFDGWYSKIQEIMVQNPDFKFLNNKRNFILKEGKSPKRKTKHILEIHDYLKIDCNPPMILIKDPKGKTKEEILEETKEVREIPDPTKIKISQEYYFEENDTKPALEIIREWLDFLENTTSECYSKF